MSAASFDLNIEAGATFKLVLSVKTGTDAGAPALDLTDWTPRLQIRAEAGALGVLLDCSPTNTRIAVSNAVAGEITLNIPAVDTACLLSGGVYDLIITNGTTGEVRRLLKGNATLSPAVTR